MTTPPADKPPPAAGTTHEELTVARRPARAEIGLPPAAAPVVEILSARYADAAAWYRGAIVVLRTTENPDRFGQAAHSLREVMDAVGRLAGLPQPEEEGSLGAKFKNMKKKFAQARSRSQCHDGEQWSNGGEIDVHAQAALMAVEEVIAWDDANRRERREIFIQARRALDGSGRALPKVEEDRLWRAWNKTRSYFISVAHHGRNVDEGEFDQHLEQLEGSILRMFRGDAYEEQRLIASLIDEAERGS
jgi:hypothetical protein